MSSPSDSLPAQAAARNRTIIRVSLTGIGVNVLLAGFKAAIGLLSGSIAVTLDAVNNLSDALSSVITIIGTRLAGRLPDKKHPLGYGRVEYLSAMIVSAIVLYAGLTSAVESIKSILHPEVPSYTTVSLIVIGAAVLAKLLLGRYVAGQGIKVHSAALEASGADASFDALLSLSVLVCALIGKWTGFSAESYVGLVISCFILKSGIEMIRETLNDILGQRADKALTDKIKQVLREEPQVLGAYDLALFNFGPSRNYASVHLELPEALTVLEVDKLTRRAQQHVFEQTGVILTGVSVYARNTEDPAVIALRENVNQMVTAHPWALQTHGFYADLEKKDVRFDTVLSFDITVGEGLATLHRELAAAYPGYRFTIVPDVYVSD